VDQGADRQVSESKRSGKPRTGLQQLEDDFTRNTAPTPDGVKTLLDDIAAKNPKAAAAKPRDFVDMSFVEEVERSGFIKQLYGR
jgi:hypothetical protein